MHPLQARREQLDLSVRALARQAEITAATIYKIENRSTRRVTAATAEALAAALNCPVIDLFARDEVLPQESAADSKLPSIRPRDRLCEKCFTVIPVTKEECPECS